MKRFNKKGFTLIELLAVITIMGVLAMIAVPMVSTYINKSKTDSFVYTAKQYAKAVDDAYLMGKLECYDDGGNTWYPIDENLAENTTRSYQVVFDTRSNKTGSGNFYANENYKKLIKDGGKSPFGDVDVYGYVLCTLNSDDETFKISIRDTKGNGTRDSFINTSQINSNNFIRKNSAATAKMNSVSVCKVK
ncbi:MAG: type II secretion system protein [Firmicutes bacterium]|nr:type II secretion system protein [Bacillota bacterium]